MGSWKTLGCNVLDLTATKSLNVVNQYAICPVQYKANIKQFWGKKTSFYTPNIFASCTSAAIFHKPFGVMTQNLK